MPCMKHEGIPTLFKQIHYLYLVSHKTGGHATRAVIMQAHAWVENVPSYIGP